MNKTVNKTYSLIYTLAILLAFTFNVVSVTATPTSGSLTINKFDVNRYENLKESTGQASDENNLPSQAIKMAGVEFKVEKLLVGAGVTNITPATPVDTTFTAIIKQTDNDGIAKFTDLPIGYYLVTENIPSGYGSPEDGQFVVAIPIITEDTNGIKTSNYDAVVFPKNQKLLDQHINPTPPSGDGVIPTPPRGDEITITPTLSVTPSVAITSSGGHQGTGNSLRTAGYAMSAKTGDLNNIMGLLVLMIASSGIITSIIKRRKSAT